MAKPIISDGQLEHTWVPRQGSDFRIVSEKKELQAMWDANQHLTKYNQPAPYFWFTGH
jgi:hypothetical protein